MSEYKAYFSYLIYYSPNLVPVEEHRCTMFKHGIMDSICTHLLSQSIPTYHELIGVAKMDEHNENMIEFQKGKSEHKELASPSMYNSPSKNPIENVFSKGQSGP